MNRFCLIDKKNNTFLFTFDVISFESVTFIPDFWTTFAFNVRQKQTGYYYFTEDKELNFLRISIYLRRSEISVEKESVCNVTEKLAKHSIHCLPCSGTKDGIYLLP